MDELLDTDTGRRIQDRMGRTGARESFKKAIRTVQKSLKDTRNVPRREELLEAVLREVQKYLAEVKWRELRRVINATGILIHTNLGRSPLGAGIFNKLSEILSGYTNLEFNLDTGKRGGRGGALPELLALLLDAEAAFAVNNNAAAVMLVLAAFAKNREVIVSRGELVQIGGGFRIPDVLRASGAMLREVGTTNVTTLDDFADAQGPKTAIMLKVHHSNYHMEGFVDSPSVKQISGIKSPEVLLVHDLGSGWMGGSEILHDEPTPAQSLAHGADIVCFSGDKLLGGPQAGIVAGKKEYVDAARTNPLQRALRMDKITAMCLEETVRLHLNGKKDQIPLYGMLDASVDYLKKRAERIVKQSSFGEGKIEIVQTVSFAGGGSAPRTRIPSAGMALCLEWPADRVISFFRNCDPPVICRVHEGRTILDMRSILPGDEPELAAALVKLRESIEKRKAE